MTVQKNSSFLFIIALVLLQVKQSQQADCVVQNDELVVPSSGCSLQFNQSQPIVVDKLILQGKLTINRHAHLQYRQLVVQQGGGMDINSNYEKIAIEDIGNDSCEPSEQESPSLEMTLQSKSQNIIYNIYGIINHNELILKDNPLGLFYGVQILVSSLAGKTELAEVDRVVGKTVYLKNKLKNNHQSWKISSSTQYEEYPQLVIIDEQRIVFKRGCLRMMIKKPLNSPKNTGVIFQDMKGLFLVNESQFSISELSHTIFINSESVTNSFYEIQGIFSDIILIGINKITIQDQTMNSLFSRFSFYRMKSAIVQMNAENFKPNLHDQNLFSDCNLKIVFNDKMTFKINNSQFLNSEITFSNQLAYQMNIINSKILNSVFKSEDYHINDLEISQCYIAGKELNLETIWFENGTIKNNYFNGKDLKYAIYLTEISTLKKKTSMLLLKIDGNHFINFEDHGYPLITSSLKSDNYEEGVLIHSKVQYVVLLLVNYYNILPGSSQKVIFLPSLVLWHTDNSGKPEQNLIPLSKDLYSKTRFQRILPETSIIYHKPLFKFNSSLATIEFDIGDIQGYHFESITQEFQEQWLMNKPYYLLEDTIYRAYFKQSNTNEISPAPTTLKMKIFQDTKNTFNKIPQIKLYFKPTLPILSIQIKKNDEEVSSSNYVSIDPIDGSLNIYPQSNSLLEETEISLEIKICKEGQFVANDICMFKCPENYLHLNHVCQDLEDKTRNNYFFKEGKFLPCLKNQNSQCKTCSDENTCSECILPSLSPNFQCQAKLYQQLLVKEGSTVTYKNCINNCQECSDISTCDACLDGFALSDDKKTCEICAKGNFIKNNKCTPCNPLLNCDECFSDKGGACRSCKQGFTLSQGFCQQECKSNQYLDKNGTCQLCHSSCLECNNGGIDNCTRCQAGNMLSINKDQKQGKCIASTCSKLQFINNNYQCQNCFDQTNQNGCYDAYPHSITCEAGQVVKISFSGCHQCDASCKGCQYESSNCLQCNQNYVFVKGNSGKCTQCPDGQYFSEGKCQNCNSHCKKCQGTKDSCLSCNQGYYLENSICKKCDSSCLECNKSSSLCTSCVPGKVLSNGKCVNCDQNCAECFKSPGNCTKCNEKTYLLTNKCVEQCPKTKYKNEEQRVCEDCDFTFCKECEGEKYFCTDCNENLYLEENKCVKYCSKGFEINGNKCNKKQDKIPDIKVSKDNEDKGLNVGVLIIGIILVILLIIYVYSTKGSKTYKQIEQKEKNNKNINNQIQMQQDIESKNSFDDENIKLRPSQKIA